MRRRLALWLASVVALATAGVATARQEHAATAVPALDGAPPGDARSGRLVYQRVGCYQCHGTAGEGAGQFGPKLAPGPLPFAAYQHQLRAPRGLMPVYTVRVLPDREVADIYAYLASQPKAKTPEQVPLLMVR